MKHDMNPYYAMMIDLSSGVLFIAIMIICLMLYSYKRRYRFSYGINIWRGYMPS